MQGLFQNNLLAMEKRYGYFLQKYKRVKISPKYKNKKNNITKKKKEKESVRVHNGEEQYHHL